MPEFHSNINLTPSNSIVEALENSDCAALAQALIEYHTKAVDPTYEGAEYSVNYHLDCYCVSSDPVKWVVKTIDRLRSLEKEFQKIIALNPSMAIAHDSELKGTQALHEFDTALKNFKASCSDLKEEFDTNVIFALRNSLNLLDPTGKKFEENGKFSKFKTHFETILKYNEEYQELSSKLGKKPFKEIFDKYTELKTQQQELNVRKKK